MKRTTITPVFVDFIPEKLDEGVIYISESYKTIVHRCCCGCGHEELLSNLVFRAKSSGDPVSGIDFNAILEWDAGNHFGKIIKSSLATPGFLG